MPNPAESAQHLADMGLQVFPCAQDKKPRVPRGHDWRLPFDYQWRDDDLIGVAVPDGTVVLDIDNVERFKQAGLEVVQSTYSPTRRDGGLHIYYRTDGRKPPQVTDGPRRGFDTRVGGMGYVIAWYPDDWTPPDTWAHAPEFLYEAPKTNGAAHRQPGDPMGTRSDILSYLGRLAMSGDLGEREYLRLLLGKLEDGEIVSLDRKNPWTDRDLAQLAREAAKWEPMKAAAPLILTTQAAPEHLSGMNGAELLTKQFSDLNWQVPGLIPEGLGLIAAPPKSGKSVFAYQMSVEIAFGGNVLGKTVNQGNVLYYALEDGPRRSQQRVTDMLRGRTRGISNLELRWTSPRLGGDLEKEVHAWLGQHPRSLVIIDVLAKVRPDGGGKSSQNAYDADYDALAGIHTVAKMNPGSTVLIVTHDRKAGSDDWMTRVTGTRGVTGAADFVVYINRDRGKPGGKIAVSGRDVEDTLIDVEFDVTGWRPAAMEFIIGENHPTRITIYNWVKENGPAWQKEIAEGTGLDYAVVRNRVMDMNKDGQIVTAPDRLGYRVPEMEVLND